MKRILIITTLLTTTALSSCRLAALKYYDKHPDRLAQKCAREFPVKTDSVSHDSTSHTQAITSRTDTLPGPAAAVVSFDCDSAIKAAAADGFANGHFMIPCPPCPPSTHTTTTVHDTIDRWHTVTTTKENTAAIASVSALLDKSKADNAKTAQREYFYKRASLILLIILLVIIAVKIARFYLKKIV